MGVTNSLCKIYSVPPFYLFDQNVDDVIMIINYFIEKSDDVDAVNEDQKNNRVKVNDRTASGGWF